MNHKSEDEMNNLVFVEETEKDPAKLELWQTNTNMLRVTMEPNESDDYFRWMTIELDLDDAKALANEITRIVRLMEEESKRGTPPNRQSQTLTAEPEGNTIPAWRLKEKQTQQKLFSA